MSRQDPLDAHIPSMDSSTKKTAHDPTDAPAGELMGVEQLAVRLGVTPRHVRRLIAERRVPFIKWGHLVRFDARDIDTWIDAQRVEVRHNEGRASRCTLP